MDAAALKRRGVVPTLRPMTTLRFVPVRLPVRLPVRTAPARALVVLVAAACAVTGCSSQPRAQGGAGHVASPSASPSLVAAGDASGVSVLSGRQRADGQVLVVKVDNTRRAHPQAGVRDADVVYVEPVEGGLTRLAAVFSSTLPKTVGPVRSARESDLELLGQYGHVAFAFSGVQDKLLPKIAEADLVPLSFDGGAAGFSRRRTRPSPYNVFADPAALLAQAPDAVAARDVGFAFGPVPAGGTPTSAVRASWVAARSTFTWSSSAKRWLWSADGVPALADEGGRLGATTVLVQYVEVVTSRLHDVNGVRTPLAVTRGAGAGVMLRNGRSWPVAWARSSAGGPTLWTVDGATAAMAAGQVWVLLVDRERPARLVTPVDPPL